MASVCGKAWFNEDLFGRVMHPHRDLYPDDVNTFWLRTLRAKWVDWESQILVAVTKNEIEKEEVVGVAVWKRERTNEGIMLRRHPRYLLPYLVRKFNSVNTLIYPDRAANPVHASLLEDSLPYISHHFTTPASRQEHYYLDLLGVSPNYQGCGIGTELVHWDINAADKERVCAAVMSSEGNEGFYKRAGFDEIVGWATEGDGNPLAREGVKGGAILFRWARGCEGDGEYGKKCGATDDATD